ncbi:MAG: ABC transporter permease [Chloroflexota bacterium]|nr:ABC transporter permease [Chloroflexota bacterium]
MSPSKILLIGLLSLRRLLARPIDLFFVIALPLLITVVIGFSVFATDRGYRVGIVDEGAGPLGQALVADLEHSPAIEPHRYADADELRKAVRRGFVVAGVIVPAGFDPGVRDGSATVTFVADPARSAPLGIRSTVSAAVQRQASTRPPATVESETVATARAIPVGFSYPASANLVLFMFITGLAGIAVLIEQRALGITRRMLATPTSVGTIVAGQALGRFAIALFQGLFILVIGALVFGVRYGDLAAAVVLVIAFGLVATSISTLGGAVLRNSEQARAFAPPLGIALGMLGGCMWPLEVTGPTMKAIGHLTPHAWAMDAFVALTARGADLAAIVPQLLVLLGFSAVLLPLATWRLRVTLTR